MLNCALRIWFTILIIRYASCVPEIFYLMNGKYYTRDNICNDIYPAREVRLVSLPPGKYPSPNVFQFPTIISQEPVEDTTLYAGGVYTKRIFQYSPQSSIQKSPLPLTVKDTAESIAHQLVQDIMIHAPPVTLIYGPPQSGKTVSLAKIEFNLNQLSPSVWTIRLDLTKIFPITVNDITLQFIINNHIKNDNKDIFNRLLHVNPKKIVFILDGIDQMEDVQQQQIISLINNLVNEKKVVVVLSGNNQIFNALKHKNFQINAWNIKAMNYYECKEFLTNVWPSMLKEHINVNKLTAELNIERLDDYISKFSFLLFRTPLLLQPPTLIILAKQFMDTTTLINTDLLKRGSHPLVGCMNYVSSSIPTSSMSLVTLNHVWLNKKILYDNIYASYTQLRGDIDDPMDYGALALKQIVYEIEDKSIAIDLLLLCSERIKISEFYIDMSIEKATFLSNTMENGILPFIHSEFRYYFAAEFIIKLMLLPHNDLSIPFGLIARIFSTREYHYLLEFINFQAQTLDPWLLRAILLPDGHLRFDMLDNIIQNGFEELYIKIHNDVLQENDLFKLQLYFQDTSSSNYKLRRTFHLLQSTLLSDEIVNFFEPSSAKVRSRSDYLIDNDMLRTCELLFKSKITFITPINYNNILRLIVTKSIPNLNLFELFMKYIVPLKYDIDINELMYAAISEVGERSIPIAKLLINYSVNPTKIKYHTPSLLHAAAKWNSIELLRYVIEELGIKSINSIDNYGRTVFDVALDANPSPLYALPGFWESMYYLIKNSEGLEFITRPAGVKLEKEKLNIHKENINKHDLKLLMGMEFNDLKRINEHSDIRFIECQTMMPQDTEFAKYLTLTEFIPASSWGLQPETMALRRNSIIHKLGSSHQIIPLEMLINFRGLAALTQSERDYYRATIKCLLKHERALPNPTIVKRILSVLVATIADANDVADLSYILNSGLNSYLDRNTINEFRQLLIERSELTKISVTRSTNTLSIYERLTQSRSECLRLIFGDIESFNINININELLQSIRQPVIQCLTQRSRRTLYYPMNCYISWKDVDQFNDAIQNDRRTINRIQVNSDKFLLLLQSTEKFDNQIKAQQLIDLISFLKNINGESTKSFITGNLKMLLNNVLQYNGIAGYRQQQRLSSTINNIWQSSSLKSGVKSQFHLLPSRSVAIYAAATLPIIRAIFGTVNMCLQQENHTSNCHYAISALAVSAVLPSISYYTMKYTPWMVEQFSRTALDLLPSSMPHIFRENIKIMRNLGMKYGSHFVATGLALVGVGFDLYNIVEMSKLIDMCNGEGKDYCPNKDKIDYIISLTFSCVSIPVTAGLIISGAGLVANILVALLIITVEIVAMGLNEVAHYSQMYNTNFNENLRIFFNKAIFQSAPSDVQALARRTDWIMRVQERIERLIDSNENIVAYGIGLGALTDTELIMGTSYINMNECNVKNTNNLSRVLPAASVNRLLLCLPKQDKHNVYDNTKQTVNDAVYACRNSFVIADKEKWKNERINEKSSIIYDLEYVVRGTILGSKIYNNFYIIYNSSYTLNVIGGSGNITNTFNLRTNFFKGNIVINKQSLKNNKNILDMSALTADSLNFQWRNQWNSGSIAINNVSSYFYIKMTNKVSTNLHIIGRVKKSEKYNCHDSEDHRIAENKHGISIDGNGGESLSNMDRVIDCTMSIVRPYTDIIGSNNTNSTYKTYVWLEGAFATIEEPSAIVRIQPLQSKFIITFTNRPLLMSTIAVHYSIETKILKWNFNNDMSSSLILIIDSYRSTYLTMPQKNTSNELNTEAISSIFVDSYHGFTIYPIIDFIAVNTSISDIDIRRFNIFATINSSQLQSVIEYYRDISIYQHETYEIVTKIIQTHNKLTFMFGSSASERFYIDNTTIFLFGGDDSDVYTLSRSSRKFVWIDNQATDEAMDTLVIPDTLCESLRAKKGPVNVDNNSDCDCDSSEFDVILECLNGNTTDYNVILRNYELSSTNQHIVIIWNDALYIIIPLQWRKSENTEIDIADDNSDDVKIGLLFSFSSEWQSTILTLTSSDNYLVLNFTSDENPLVAYKTGLNDVTLSMKYLNHYTSSYVILKDFFSSNTIDIVSNEWWKFKIFNLRNNDNSDAMPIILSAEDIRTLVFNSSQYDNEKIDSQTNLIKEYLVNIKYDENKTIIIEHNNNSQVNGYGQLGVLTLMDAIPWKFHAKWENTSLLLYFNDTRIYVKNWCLANQHRLYRIEFFPLSSNYHPIVIEHLDQLECDKTVSNQQLTINRLNQKFRNTQKLFLIGEMQDSDQSRLTNCIGAILVDIILAKQSMYKLFGFTSDVEQVIFIHDNCQVLFTKENLATISLWTMNEVMKSKIKIYRLINNVTQEENELLLILLARLKQLNDCWPNITSALYSVSEKIRINSYEMLEKIVHCLVPCIPDLQKDLLSPTQ